MRKKGIETLAQARTWDVIVIGGGASGLGIALDAVTRGFSTLLLESHDFAKGTSSRSTKLVHGGVRYLAQFDVALVREALKERGRIAKNAPQLFKDQAFVIPGEKSWTAFYYTFGLWLYDKLSGKLSLGKTKYLNKKNARAALPGIKDEKLRNGVCYFDGQFDDARLATTLMQTIQDKGGTILNYVEVTNLTKDEKGKLNGVIALDKESRQEYELKGKCIINATGVFANELIALDEPHTKPTIVPSQGIHLVFDRDFLPTDKALMVPKTSDGRVLFALHWHNKLLVGTTDTLIKDPSYEPKPLEQEIDFILTTMADYFVKPPTRQDVKSIFAGLRPLAAPKSGSKSTKEVSRSHKVEISESGFVHIFGGKWTTYRQMAQDTLDKAIQAQLLPAAECVTQDLRLHGYDASESLDQDILAVYGQDRQAIIQLAQEDECLAKRIHSDYEYNYAQVLWAIQAEMARTIEDVLARRIRLLFLDAKAANDSAAEVGAFMQSHLNWNEEETQAQIAQFKALCAHYLLSD